MSVCPMNCRAFLGIVAWILTSTALLAADLGDDVTSVHPTRGANQWTLNITPYGWLPWITGDFTVKGQTANVDTSVFEIISEADSIIPWIGYLEARKGKLSAHLDTIYANVTFSGDDERLVSPLPGLSLRIGAKAGVTYEYAIVEAGVAYEVLSHRTSAGNTALDVFAGGRYWHQDMSVRLAITGTFTLPPGFQRSGSVVTSGSVSANWVDPIIGFRLRHSVAPGQELRFRGDIGGFGAGSDFSWQIVTAFNFELGESHGIMWSGTVGYRALYADYSEGSGSDRFAYDLLQHGPMLGLSMSF